MGIWTWVKANCDFVISNLLWFILFFDFKVIIWFYCHGNYLKKLPRRKVSMVYVDPLFGSCKRTNSKPPISFHSLPFIRRRKWCTSIASVREQWIAIACTWLRNELTPFPQHSRLMEYFIFVFEYLAILFWSLFGESVEVFVSLCFTDILWCSACAIVEIMINILNVSANNMFNVGGFVYALIRKIYSRWRCANGAWQNKTKTINSEKFCCWWCWWWWWWCLQRDTIAQK